MNLTKVLKFITPVAAVVLLCGCPSMRPQYLRQPEPIAVQGTYLHPASKITMPQAVAGFQRDSILRYDIDGLDVSAGYNLLSASNHMAATVYVYPAPSLISIGSPLDVVADARAHLTEGEFERRKQEIQRAHPGAMLIEQPDTVRVENSQSYPGLFAIFEYEDVFAGLKQPLRSYLYVFCYVGGKWAIEYRFTCPKNEDAEGAIHEFIQKWSWHDTGV